MSQESRFFRTEEASLFERGGLRLGSVAGITVRLHWIFLLWGLLEWISLSRPEPGSDPTIQGNTDSTVLYYLGFLFVSVFLHEMGHCRAARQVGGNAHEVLLWPLGGLASVDVPDRPAPHLAVAMGGPMVNLILWLTLMPLAYFLGDGWGSFFLRMPVSDPLSIAAAVNFDLLVFNLLPALPLDGGRILHALTWARHGEGKAQKVLVTAGRIVSGGLFLLWLSIDGASGFLLAIAVMIFAQSYFMSRMEATGDQEWWQGSSGSKQSWWCRKREEFQQRRLDKITKREEQIRERVDQLLEKVSREGLDSLSREERSFLKTASREYEGRGQG